MEALVSQFHSRKESSRQGMFLRVGVGLCERLCVLGTDIYTFYMGMFARFFFHVCHECDVLIK